LLEGSSGAAPWLRLAVRADPQLAVAHAALAVATATATDAATAIEQAKANAHLATRRERQHIEIVGLMLSGDLGRGRALAAEHLAEFPTDELIRRIGAITRSSG
jgi:hypothetical protein